MLNGSFVSGQIVSWITYCLGWTRHYRHLELCKEMTEEITRPTDSKILHLWITSEKIWSRSHEPHVRRPPGASRKHLLLTPSTTLPPHTQHNTSASHPQHHLEPLLTLGVPMKSYRHGGCYGFLLTHSPPPSYPTGHQY